MAAYAQRSYSSGQRSQSSENFAGFGLIRFQRDAEDQERDRQRAAWQDEEWAKQELQQQHQQHQQQQYHHQQEWEQHERWQQQQQQAAASSSSGSGDYHQYHNQPHSGRDQYASTSQAYSYDNAYHSDAAQQQDDAYLYHNNSGANTSAYDTQSAYETGMAYDAGSSTHHESPAAISEPLAYTQPHAQPHHVQPHHYLPGRSNTLDSDSSGSAIGLAYDRASLALTARPRHSNQTISQQGAGPGRDFSKGTSGSGSGSGGSSGETQRPVARRRSKVLNHTSFDRETRYDDDFEESQDDADITPAGWASVSRFSHFVPSDVSTWRTAAAAGPHNERDNAAPSLPVPHLETPHNRSTVFMAELPKAKCADCGEHFSFEELSDHSCVPRGTSKTSMLTIQVPSPRLDHGLLSSPSTPSTAGLGARSPFFDRYSHVVGDGGRLSPAFAVSTPASTRSEFISRFESDGAGSAATSPTEATPPSLSRNGHRLPSLVEPAAASSGMQQSVSDGEPEAMERRRMIEQQRAAKKQASAAAAAAATVVAALRLKTGGQDYHEKSVKAALSPTLPLSPAGSQVISMPKKAQQGREVPHLKQPSSSSNSSRASSHLDPLFLSGSGGGQSTRQRQHSSDTTSSAALTPSSSYDRFTETTSSPATTTYSPVRATPGRSATSRSGNNKLEIDLAGIEDLMRGLTASPQSMSKELLDGDDADGHDGHHVDSGDDDDGDNDARRTSEAKRAASKEDSERERDREMDREIERLKEKEKMRQLLKLRKREREARKREAKKCCICDCSLSSSRTPFVERDGKLLCAKDWKDLYLPKCRKCNLSVERGAVKSSDGALKGVFHRGCFSCFTCDRPFEDGSFYVHGNQPYCASHYHQVNGSLCRWCGHGVEGDCRQTESGDRFHPQCFRCEYDNKGLICRQILDEYFNVDGRRLCEAHAEKVSRRLQRHGQKGLDLKADRRKTMLRTL